MVGMATWEDGPEYAPLERPDAFDAPSANPSDLAPPPTSPAQPPAPLDRPVFAGPHQPGPQLADLVPVPPEQRNPNEPFDVVSSLVTAESSAWASAHWSQPSASPGQPYPQVQHYPPGQPSAPVQPPAPTQPGQPYPVAAQPYPPTQPYPAQPSANGSFPAPGTPQWFAPGPGYQQPPRPPVAPSARTVLAAATPGVLITLVVGGLIWILAPITVVLALLLTGRMTYGRRQARLAFTIALSLGGLYGIATLLTSDGNYAQWWDSLAGWLCFGSWLLVASVLIVAYQELQKGRPDPPPGARRPPR